MRAVACWPNKVLRFEYQKDDDGEPFMAAVHHGTPRPVFWVLATKEEAEEHIVPHMVNAVFYYRHKMKKPWELEDGWAFSDTKELSFYVPLPCKLTDPPTLCFRVFPYSGMQTDRPQSLGGHSFGSSTGGIQIPDISTETLKRILDSI